VNFRLGSGLEARRFVGVAATFPAAYFIFGPEFVGNTVGIHNYELMLDVVKGRRGVESRSGRVGSCTKEGQVGLVLQLNLTMAVACSFVCRKLNITVAVSRGSGDRKIGKWEREKGERGRGPAPAAKSSQTK